MQIGWISFAKPLQVVFGTLRKEPVLIELNKFELKRLVPMTKFPEAYEIDRKKIMPWPWVSVVFEMEKTTRLSKVAKRMGC